MADQMAGHENARLKMKRLAVVVLNFKRNKEKTNEDQNKGGLSSGIAAYFCITRYLRSSSCYWNDVGLKFSGPAISGSVFSCHAVWSVIFRSCIFRRPESIPNTFFIVLSCIYFSHITVSSLLNSDLRMMLMMINEWLTNHRQSVVEMRRLRKPISETSLTSADQIQQNHQILNRIHKLRQSINCKYEQA